jgi:hypothetical protein
LGGEVGRENAGADNTAEVKSCAAVLAVCLGGIARRTRPGDVCVTCRALACAETGARCAAGFACAFIGRACVPDCSADTGMRLPVALPEREPDKEPAAAGVIADPDRPHPCAAAAAADAEAADADAPPALPGSGLSHPAGATGSTCTERTGAADVTPAREDASFTAPARFTPLFPVDAGRQAVGR